MDVDTVLVAVGAMVAAGLVGLGVLVAVLSSPLRRFTRTLDDFRASLAQQIQKLRTGAVRRTRVRGA